MADREAPDRIEEIVATDRPEDDGRAVLLEFLPAQQATSNPTKSTSSVHPSTASAKMRLQAWCSIAPNFPIVVDRYSDGSPLSPTSPFTRGRGA